MSIRIQGNTVIDDNQRFTSRLNMATGIANNSFNVARTLLGSIHIANGAGVSGNNRQAAITFQGSDANQAQAGIYVSNNNSTGTAMGFATTDSYATGPQLFMTATNGGLVQTLRSYFQAAGSARAPIFYDSNNTGYYIDPTSTTAIRTVGSWRADSGAWDGEFAGKIQYHSNHWYIQGGNLFIYRNSGGSNVFTINQSGVAEATGDMRAPIFYDSNNTGYYLDPNGRRSSNIDGFSARTKMTLGLTAKYQLDRADYTSDINYWVGTMGWGTTDFNSVLTWGSGFIDTWSSPGNRPTTAYSHFVGQQSLHYTTGATNGTGAYGYQLVMGGGTNAPLYARTFWNSMGSWRQLTQYDFNNGAGALYATIYYDSNNTARYVDPSGSSELGEIYATGWFRNYGDRGWYSQTYGYGLWWAQSGGNAYGNVTTYATGRNGWDGYGIQSRWAFMGRSGDCGVHDNNLGWVWYRNASDIYFYHAGSERMGTRSFGVVVNNRLDSPIYYDLNNTGFYTDPASTSRMNTIQPNIHTSPFSGGNSGLNRASFPYSYGFQNTGGWSPPYPDLVLHYHTGIIMAANPSYQGIRFLNDYNNDTLRFQINGGSSYTYKYTWMYTNSTGFYSDVNGWHIEPNSLSSYGSMRLRGNRSGWYGMVIDTGNRPHVMFDGSGNGGFYHQDGGRWSFYYQYANNCVGMVGSTTSSAYGLYVSKAIFSTGNVVAFSDARKKENIITIDSPLEKINSLRGVYYNRIGVEDKKRETGVIAQEVNEVLPEVVTYAEDVDEYGVSYGNFAGLFIEAIKEQNKIIESMKQEIQQLKNRIGE